MKIIKRILWIIAFLIFLMVIMGLLAYRYGNNYIENKANNLLASDLIGHYTINYDSLSINIFKSEVKILNLKITPDTSEILISSSESIVKFLNFSADSILINDLSIRKYLLRNTINLDHLSFYSPHISYNIQENNKASRQEDKAAGDPDSTFTETKNTRKQITKIHLDNLGIYTGSFNFHKTNSKASSFSIREIDIHVSNAAYDLSADTSFLDALSMEKISFYLKPEHISLPGNEFKLKINEISGSTISNSILIKSLSFSPKAGKLELGKIKGVQTNWISLNIEEISLKGFDIPEMIQDKKIKFETVKLSKGDLFIFIDKNIPSNADKYKKLPQEALLDLKMPLMINTMEVSNSSIRYEDLVEKVKKSGYITLDSLNAKAVNITNMEEAIKINNSITLTGDFLLYNKGLTNVIINLPLDKNKNSFSFSGQLDTMDLKILNPIIEPELRLRIKSGKLHQLTFNTFADSVRSTGAMQMEYDKLKLNFLRKKSSLYELSPVQWLTSGVANNIIYKKNPQQDMPARTGSMNFERDPNKGIINYMVRALAEGAINIILPGRNEKEIKEAKKREKEERKKK